MGKINMISIDDEPTFAYLINSYCKLDDFKDKVTVVSYDNVSDFFSEFMLLKPKPDLILLDLNMPVIDGFDFLDIYMEQSYHKKFKEIPVFVLSSSVNSNDIERVQNYEMKVKFIEKKPSKQLIQDIIDAYEELTVHE